MPSPTLPGLSLAALAAALLGACTIPPTVAPAMLADRGPATPAIDPVIGDCNVVLPDTPVTDALLTSGLPCEPQFVPPFDLDNLQRGFDYYSWLTFIALNAATPGTAPATDNAAPTLWADWKNGADIMLAGGATPAPWDAPPSIPAACQAVAGAADMRVVHRTSLNKQVLAEVDQPFDTGPLIDQNGNFVRYEALFNRPMFEYIVQNDLYRKTAQPGFAGAVDFPAGKVTGGSTGTVGAMMVKAAWKVMGAGDDRSRFHLVDALAYNPPSKDPAVVESCAAVTLGLVGWHVAHKTDDAPQWIWSTFEHVDNVPDAGALTAGRVAGHYSFFNPGCNGECTTNQPPPRPWNPDVQPFANGFTSQITRVVPLDAATVALNTSFQQILAGTAWQHYQLVSTQWPTDAGSATDPNGVPAPVFLANTTLETYSQGEVPQASSSCMACHGNATDTASRESDFTFLLGNAQ